MAKERRAEEPEQSVFFPVSRDQNTEKMLDALLELPEEELRRAAQFPSTPEEKKAYEKLLAKRRKPFLERPTDRDLYKPVDCYDHSNL